MQTTNVIGTPCLNTSHRGLLDLVEARTGNGHSEVTSVDFTNVHITAMRRTDREFRRITDPYDFFVPDSQILKWAVNLRGGGMEERVYGPDFLDFAIRHARPETTHYFLGASQDCLDALIAKTRQRRPGFNLIGSHNGYFKPGENAAILDEINRLGPDIVWIGLGTPAQQQWIFENRDKLKRGALLAVGFAFDVNAGTKKDAPPWMQKAGLTWLFRLASEPRRLWKRYFYFNSVFLFLLVLQCLRVKRFPIPEATAPGGPPRLSDKHESA